MASVEDLVARHIPEEAYPEQWDTAALKEGVMQFLNLDLPIEEWAKEEGIADAELRERIRKLADEDYAARIARNTDEVMTLCREAGPAADARPSLARASRHARPSAPGHRLARLCPARPAERVQAGGVQPVRQP